MRFKLFESAEFFVREGQSFFVNNFPFHKVKNFAITASGAGFFDYLNPSFLQKMINPSLRVPFLLLTLITIPLPPKTVLFPNSYCKTRKKASTQ